MSVSPSEEENTIKGENIDVARSIEAEDGCAGTGTGTRAGSNYQITSTVPISMPEESGVWNQSDFGGGPGQSVWIDPDRFNTTIGLNYSTADGHLELARGGSDFENWDLVGDGATPRVRHKMVWAASRGVFYVFGGGKTWSEYTNDLYQYDPGTGVWKQIGKTGAPPARAYHILVWDSINGLLWVYGGRDSSFNLMNDLWEYNPVSDAWTSKGNGPGARSDATGVFNNGTGEIIVYGGYLGTSQYSNQVYAYDTHFNSWAMKQNFTKRYYHSAVWCPDRMSMLVYGGWDGSAYVTFLSEYFPVNDTWFNRTGIGTRNRAILGWDSLNKNMVLCAGTASTSQNETWYYDPYTQIWTQKLTMPVTANDLYYCDGDWDDIHNQFIIYGGGYSTISDDVWAYFPNATGYCRSGDLTSSVYGPGYTMNPGYVSFGLQRPMSSKVGTQPVKLQIAGSITSSAAADQFIGPNGKDTSYFIYEKEQAIPAVLAKCTYIAFKLNLSTAHQMHTPKLKWVQLEYFTYPEEHIFDSETFDIGRQGGLPLRYVNWTSDEPAGTAIEIYFRQSHIQNIPPSTAWEKVDKEQVQFGYKTGRYFQYRAVMSTEDIGYTPELTGITFTFNALPSKPQVEMPANNSWLGVARPRLQWEFTDPDTGDHQTAFEVNVAFTETMESIIYSSINDSLDEECTIGDALADGEYFWHVRTCDNYGSWGEWSDTYGFNIDCTKPVAPKIQCYSHPLDNVWYSKDRAVFDWNEPDDACGIAGFSYLLSRSPDDEPLNNISMSIEEFQQIHNTTEFSGLVIEDGIDTGEWYFHVKAVDNLGYWSDKATKTLLIDTVGPATADLSPKTVEPGAVLKLRFNINDNNSGVFLATMYWKYESDLDYRYEELILEDTGGYVFTHTIEQGADSYLDYYLETFDRSEPQNMVRFPASGSVRVRILDMFPPTVQEVTGDITHNAYQTLEIKVKATDNAGVSEVKIYFNDEASGRSMTKISDDTYSIKFDRVQLTDLLEDPGSKYIRYKITVTDFQQNKVTVPASGNFNITLLTADDSTGGDTAGDEGGVSYLVWIAVGLVVVILFVAIVLFFFIKRQSKGISEFRHELRMAVTDAQGGSGEETALPPMGLDGVPQAPALPETGTYAAGQGDGADLAVLPPAVAAAGAEVPAPVPLTEDLAAEPAYLPEPAVSAPGPAEGAGMVAAVPQPPPAETTEVKTDAEKAPVVEVEGGLFVSLPPEVTKTNEDTSSKKNRTV